MDTLLYKAIDEKYQLENTFYKKLLDKKFVLIEDIGDSLSVEDDNDQIMTLTKELSDLKQL